MAEIGVRGTEKGKEVSIADILKTLVSRSLSSPVSRTTTGIKAQEILKILSEKAPHEYGSWDVLYEAPSESAAQRGLKFVGELELSEVKSQVDDLNSQVKSVVSELQQCKEGISAILNELNELKEKPITKQTELFEIDEALEVIRPIPVVIEEYDDEVIATFPEIEAFGAGLCEAEAIINLKNEIRKIFLELEGVSDDKLGKLPLSWKRVLLKVVKKIGDTR
jgi:hypothetical protein